MDMTAITTILDGAPAAIAAVGASLLAIPATRAIWNAVRGFIK